MKKKKRRSPTSKGSPAKTQPSAKAKAKAQAAKSSPPNAKPALVGEEGEADERTTPVEKVTRYVGDVEHLLRKYGKKLTEDERNRVRDALDALRSALADVPADVDDAYDKLQATVGEVINPKRKSTLREYAESLTAAVAVAFLLRFFVLEAFKIPTGSMIPTLEIGDHIFVNKFIYGLRVPLANESWIARWGSPERGHVIVFRYPLDKSKDYIKRVVAVAGDRVWVRGHDVYVNGKKLGHSAPVAVQSTEDDLMGQSFTGYTETNVSGDLDYTIQYAKYPSADDPRRRFPHHPRRLDGLDCSVVAETEAYCTVEPEHVFVMGDNRDNSLDSREWGGVPHALVKGRAMFVWFSWGPQGVNWSRFGKAVR